MLVARDEELVRALGADEVVVRGAEFAHGVRRIAAEGVDGLVDAAVMNGNAVFAVRDGGRIATLRGYEGGDAESRGITFCPIFVRNYARERDKLNALRNLVELGALVAQGGPNPSRVGGS